MRLTRSVALPAAAIVLVTIAAYGRSLSGAFVSDDVQNVRDNELLRSLDWAHVRGIVTSFDDANYIPVKVPSLAVDTRLWGPSPTGYHVTNLILHIVEAVLLWALLRRLSIRGAFLAALLFAVHPVNVETVAWIAQRKTLLAMLFFLLSILWYLKAQAPSSCRRRSHDY